MPNHNKTPVNKYSYEYLNKKIQGVKDHLYDLFEEKRQLINQGDIRENGGLDIANETIRVFNKKLKSLSTFRNDVELVNEKIAKVGVQVVLKNCVKIILTLFKTLISECRSEIYISSELQMAKDLFYKVEGDEFNYTLDNIKQNTTIVSIIDLGDNFENIER